MKATFTVLRLASTHHGMRRILKRPLSPVDFIRKAVIAGVYKSEKSDNPVKSKQDNEGSQRLIFPVEYEILSLNPPIPLPARVPKKIIRREQREAARNKNINEIDRFAKKYLRRQTQSVFGQNSLDASLDDYYRKLLGIPPPVASSNMGQKSTLLNKAYAVALKQQELLRSNSALTEHESLQMVEELLDQEAKAERHHSRAQQVKIREESNETTTTSTKTSITPKVQQDQPKLVAATRFAHKRSINSNDNDTEAFLSSVPSVLHSKPRTIQGIAIWSKRLQAIPYKEWTIGATVALDHFIARSILDISEETWDALLEGSDPSLKSMGQDILLTRCSLFPETMPVENSDQPAYHDFNFDDDQESSEEMDASIDDLLASLGGTDDGQMATKANVTGGAHVSTPEKLLEELQTWRSKQMVVDYEDWSDREKNEFSSWLETYVRSLQDEDEIHDIDWDATRQAMLAVPPTSKDESQEFWDSLRDQTQVEIFLENLCPQGEHDEEGMLSPFWNLPHSEQVRRLTALGSLRPLLDEYADPEHRRAFLERHVDKLLEGVPLEHIVKDPKGAIAGSDLMKIATIQDVDENDRFSIQKLPYGSDEKGRMMLAEWNRHKAGRARYEEHMFREGKLGLRYEKEDSNKKKK